MDYKLGDKETWDGVKEKSVEESTDERWPSEAYDCLAEEVGSLADMLPYAVELIATGIDLGLAIAENAAKKES